MVATEAQAQERQAQDRDASDAIAAAAARLAAALDALDAAAERRREADRQAQALSDQFHALDDDRARLASELDDTAARAKHLQGANRDIAERIEAAIETIRAVLNSA
jgi:chromosome segregation ATPase